MKYKILNYSDPKKFYIDIAPHLKIEESKNSLLLGLTFDFQFEAKSCLYQSALFKEDEFIGALICSRFHENFNLIASPIDKPELLFEDFCKTKIKATALIAEEKTGIEYKKLLEHQGINLKLNMRQGIYKNQQVIMPPNTDNCVFRKASLNDLETIANWIELFRQEAIPNDPRVDATQLAKSKIEKEMFFVLEKDQQLVSMAAMSRDIGTSCSMNSVYTPINFRKRGYGGLISALLTDYLLSKGKAEINLYTDWNNPTSNKIYQNIGYEFVCNSVHFLALK